MLSLLKSGVGFGRELFSWKQRVFKKWVTGRINIGEIVID